MENLKKNSSNIFEYKGNKKLSSIDGKVRVKTILGKPIRYLLTNNYNGPSITDIFMILGKTESIERLKRYKI